MKTIQIYNESNKTNTTLTVTNKEYNIVEGLQYLGGFKRFGMSIYDEGRHLKRTCASEIPKCMAKIFPSLNTLSAEGFCCIGF